MVRSTDAVNNSVTYTYDATGNLTQVLDPLGNTTTMAYDLRGRKTAMTDPDMGAWSYAYNTLGQLVSQTDAKGQPQTVGYDVLGRMVARTNLEGTSQWTYDTVVKGIGKPARVTGPGGFATDYVYDALGRPSAVTTTVNAEAFTVSNTYDPLGRLDTVQYPQTGFTIRRVYNALGFLTEVRNAQSNALYWQATAGDATGRIINETYGNGLGSQRFYNFQTGNLEGIRTSGATGVVQDLVFTFDLVGNLTARTDQQAFLTETFGYDALNHLVQANGAVLKTYQYNAIGNMTFKSDVGTYTYGAKPHAVAAVAGAVNASYTYDANGNMLSGAGRSLAWTSFNKPKQITTVQGSTAFTYDANHRRIVKQTLTATTIYLGKLYEKVIQGTFIEHKHNLYAGSSLIGVYTSRNTGVNDTRYFHTCHLDSVETITDEAGHLVEKLSFDPHGKRRNPNGTDATGPITSSTTKGFTRHEHDDEVGLINMNARLYDPTLGRFISPDTIIQAPDSTQGYNRYTYVNNNPLSLTDPSGHSWLSKGLKRLKKNLKRLTRKIVQKVSEIKYVGGLAATGLLSHPTFGPVYGTLTGDWKSVGRATATAAVMAASVWTGGAAAGAYGGTFVGGVIYVGESAAIGYTSSYSIARINGASRAEARQAGLGAARTSALMASFNIAAQSLAKVGLREDLKTNDPAVTSMTEDLKADVTKPHVFKAKGEANFGGVQNTAAKHGGTPQWYGADGATGRVVGNAPVGNFAALVWDSLDQPIAGPISFMRWVGAGLVAIPTAYAAISAQTGIVFAHVGYQSARTDEEDILSVQ